MRKQLAALAILTASFSPITSAADSGIAAGLNGGLFLGAGIQGSFALKPQRLNLRGGFHAGTLTFNDLSLDSEVSGQADMELTAELDLSSAQLLADYFPLGGNFRLSGGVLSLGNELTGRAICDAASCDVDGNIFLQGEGGDLTLDWSGAAPYLGLGWGNPVLPGKGLGFMFDLGIALQGSPEARFETDARRCDAACREDIAREAEDEAADLDVLPVISLGLSYQF